MMRIARGLAFTALALLFLAVLLVSGPVSLVGLLRIFGSPG